MYCQKVCLNFEEILDKVVYNMIQLICKAIIRYTFRHGKISPLFLFAISEGTLPLSWSQIIYATILLIWHFRNQFILLY